MTGPLDPTHDSFWHKLQVFSSIEPEQRTYLQDQCAFLSKLPLDVRVIVYEMVLGGNMFHVTASDRGERIFHHVCKQPNLPSVDDHQPYSCFESPERRPSSAPREDYAQATGLLPLLVTCRRIYSEAIETLYNANTFEFTKIRVVFTFLKVMLPPHRLRCIRRFRWAMQIPHHPDANTRSRRDWNDLFKFFTNETSGLQHFYLKLNRNYRFESDVLRTRDDAAVGWIEPMMIMATDANQKRGCKVEIVTNGIVHEPASIFKATASANQAETHEEILTLACIEMHRRIRLSFEGNG